MFSIGAGGGGKKKRKYGLVKPSASASGAFGAASRDDGDDAADGGFASGRAAVNAALARRSASSAASAAAAAAAALDQDASAFDYDGVYDSMVEARDGARSAKRAAVAGTAGAGKPKPRYIANMMKCAELRKVDDERAYERKLLREQQEDDDEHGPTEKFITASCVWAKSAARP